MSKASTKKAPGFGCDDAFYEGDLQTFRGCIDAAFILASSDDTRPHLSQVALGRFHDRLCIAATDGHALIVHWLDDRGGKKPKPKASFHPITTIGRDEWRFMRAIMVAAGKRATGRIEAHAHGLQFKNVSGFGPRGYDVFAHSGEEARNFPPIDGVCVAPSEPAGPNDSYVYAILLARVIESLTKHAKAIAGVGDPAIGFIHRAELDPVFIHTPYSFAIMMPMRADSRAFEFGREVWTARKAV